MRGITETMENRPEIGFASYYRKFTLIQLFAR